MLLPYGIVGIKHGRTATHLGPDDLKVCSIFIWIEADLARTVAERHFLSHREIEISVNYDIAYVDGLGTIGRRARCIVWR